MNRDRFQNLPNDALAMQAGTRCCELARDIRPRPWPWSFDLLQHANLLLIRVPCLLSPQITYAQGEWRRIFCTMPIRMGQSLRALALALRTAALLSRQSDRIAGLQCHSARTTRLIAITSRDHVGGSSR